ncbi:hypothetical protein BASA61_002129 [Batrachochytrium salamandrivorans]|nr:hypothetical protein BASA61_002129 [Batrachochytrium salamandrivorans]
MNFQASGLGGGSLMGLFGSYRHEQALEQEVTARTHKATTGLSDLIVQTANDTSLGLYRVQEHVHKKVPHIINDRQMLLQTRANIAIAVSDAAEIQDLLRGMDRIDSFAKCTEYINQIAKLQTRPS